MEITVNGKKETLEKELSVNELLQTLNVEMPQYVTVQINEELIDREDFENLIVVEGDEVEFLYFMGGGTL
ncbi:MAG: sulfur carrier protein ThiS [Peptococcaceae bacterium]|nr:sulfur carrier protein ThiS [Peptococcaceae bacterium]